jgi:regulatory protein
MIDRQIYDRLTRYCEGQERCRHDVIQKCYRLKIDKSASEEYIVQLEKSGFLNENRYLKLYIESHLNYKKWGFAKIRAALSAKGFKASQYKHLIDTADVNDYYNAALKIAIKKNATIKSKSSQDHRMKLIRFLMGKGYEQEIIKRVMKQLSAV